MAGFVETSGSAALSIAQLSAIVRQHARTCRLLGVDYLPLSGVFAEQRTPKTITHSVQAASAPFPTAAAIAVELKPVPTPPAPRARPVFPAQPIHASTRVEPPADVLIDVSATNFGPRPHPLLATDPARQAAQNRLDALQARYEADAPHNAFVTDHHCIVFGEGDPCARLVFVGEAPGADEDRLGRPFIGRAGQLLEKMIIAMGLARSDVYICNVLKTRPPNNATPTLEEAALCAPYLYEQLLIINPEVVVTLGLPATRTILSSTSSMSELRGKWGSFDAPATGRLSGAGTASGPARAIPVMPTYHPAFLLRSYTKENRQKVWSDLTQVVQRLGLKPPPPLPASPAPGAE